MGKPNSGSPGRSQLNLKEIVQDAEAFQALLKKLNLKKEDFFALLDWEIDERERKEKRKFFWLKENLEKIKPIGAQWKYAYTVNLDKHSLDLSIGDPTEYRSKKLIGRENELELVNLILSRPDQNDLILVGDEGIGKTTLIHNLASFARLNRSGSYLRQKRILIFDLDQAISQAIETGKDVESYLEVLFQEAAYAGNVILTIKNIGNYLGDQAQLRQIDINSILAVYLPHPSFQVLATSSRKEYHRLVEKHEGLMKYFEVVEMREPTEEEAVRILLDFFREEEKNRVVFTYKAFQRIVTLSERYRWELPLPERAIDLSQKTIVFWQSSSDSPLITPEVVNQFVTLETGTPQGLIGEEEKDKLLNLENLLHNRVVGQEEAINQVAEALRRARSGINDPLRPIGSFLFLGPTGVGKTETAKALAEVYFGGENKIIRLDMSEFQSVASFGRLIGSPELGEPGRLVNLVKENPFSLLLLDELEKADSRILDLFLQVLEEGFITDAFGNKVNFRNMIIIATSNAGSVLIKKSIEEGMPAAELKKALIDYIVENNIFKVEFLNRFDGVIFFRPLVQEELKEVVRLMLAKLAKRLNQEKGLEVVFDESIIEKIIQEGYSLIFGARSLRRFVEEKIENIVARKIIAGEVVAGEKITISLSDF